MSTMSDNAPVCFSVINEKKIITNDGNENGNTIVYLNNAAQARLSPDVQQAGIDAVLRKAQDSNVHAAADLRRIRQLFAHIIGSDNDSNNNNPIITVAVHPSTAFAISLAAENISRDWHLKQQIAGNNKGDDANNNNDNDKTVGKILLLQDQFSSAVYPWQNICQKSNGTLQLDILPHPPKNEKDSGGDGSWTEAVLNCIETYDNKKNTTLVAACLPPLHWSNGALLDLVRIGQACRQRNIPLIVDATQATGIMECRVSQIQPAMLCCSVHKWLRSPSGVSLCYINPQFFEKWEPLDQHSRGRQNNPTTWEVTPNEMDPKTGYPEPFYKDARKFDCGGKPNPILLPMLRAALEEVVATVDIPEAQSHLKNLLAPLLDWAHTHGYTLPDAHAYHLVGIHPPHLTPVQMMDVAKQLQQQDIYISVRCGCFRISPYLDTKQEEIQRFIEALGNTH